MPFLDKQSKSRRKKSNQVILESIHIGKCIAGRVILTDVNFKLKEGEIIGLGGATGSGKTTLLHILLGLIKPDNGKVEVLKQDLELNRSQLLRHMNFASSSLKLSGYATIMENLSTFGELYQIANHSQKISELISLFELTDLVKAKTKIYNLSAGESSRVNLCKALLNDPPILLLDEITAHLDPLTVTQLKKILNHRKKQGHSCIFVSHKVDELNSFCDRVMMLKQGKIKYQTSKLKGNLNKYYR